MRHLTSLAQLAVLGLLAACSGSSQDPPPATSSSPGSNASGPAAEQPYPSSPVVSIATNTDVDTNLQALRDLKVVEVLGLIVDIPQNGNCYNLPCPGHEQE